LETFEVMFVIFHLVEVYISGSFPQKYMTELYKIFKNLAS